MVMGILVSLFLVYNLTLYTPTGTNKGPTLSTAALNGAKLYQDNNCTACHQFYGLGGFLGPDLTNAMSTGDDAQQRVRAFINLGYKSMPKFNFTEEELNDLVQFLTEVDRTGYYPNCANEVSPTGWVKLKTKPDDATK